jgi:hypothetical protein
LIDKFKYTLSNNWGYIYGTAGVKWTEEKQRAATREQTQLYGKKWIGHYVADCSGLFSWAFKQLGGYMYHGSNTMYKSYCNSKGKLSGGKRTDGQYLKPGTALFTGTENDHGHVGLYIGDGKVIEAKGTQAGVIESKASEKKWTYWGEMKGVDYSTSGSTSVPTSNGNQGFPEKTTWHPTIRRGSKGQDVIDMQTMLYKLGYGLGVDGIDGDYGRNTEKAVKEFQSDHRLTVDGVCGPMTWDALEKAINSLNTTPKEKTYTVCIHGLDKTQAEAMRNNYPGAVITEE